MTKKARSSPRREDSLSRHRIIDAAIVLLDSGGEDGLTFRALSERLETGPGAIYWHIASKGELLTAACDAILSGVITASEVGTTPEATIRAVALGMFDAIDGHPWIGSALMHVPGQSPMVRILESLGQQVCALGVPDHEQWSTVGALLSYILGVAGRNAANAQFARTRGIARADFLDSVATMWSGLAPDAYPFTRSLVAKLRDHDDRADFLAGIDLILRGIGAAIRD